MASMVPMPEEEPESTHQHEPHPIQEGGVAFEPEYVYESAAVSAEDQQWERDMIEGIGRLASLVGESLHAGPDSHLLSRDSILSLVADHFRGHSGDLVYSLAHAFHDFDLYRGLDKVPLLGSDDASVPVSIQTVKRRLEAAGVAEHDESYEHPGALQAAIDKWADLDDTYASGTIEQASEVLHENLESFMTNRFGGLRMWANEGIPERVRQRGTMTNADFESPVSPNVGTGLFRVTVKCKAPGYRILVSPAYFIDWLYFGAPSTPVTNEMLPGRYIFGTDSIDGSVVSDGVIFRIPTDFTPHLVRF